MERRIVVYAPIGRDAELTCEVLASAGIRAAACHDETKLLAMLHEGVGALLITEEALTLTVTSSVRHFVVEQEAWSDLPVLLLTGAGANSAQAQRAVELLGNVTLLERPVRLTALTTAAKAALRARTRQYQVRSLDKRKDEFLATLAHELRNPLSPILNVAAVFERAHPSEQTTRLVGMVNRQIKHLTRLIDDLMDVARITSGKIELRIEDTSLVRIMNNAVEIADTQIRGRRHHLEVVRPDNDLPMRVDHVRVVQALGNLLVNAVKFTPPDGRIEFVATIDGTFVDFRVSDNGRGIEPSAQSRIFEMFGQSRAVGEPSTGLGIGLHLAKTFAEMHGGRIALESKGGGQGSSFTIRIPLVAVATAATQDGKLDLQAPPTAIVRKILVVDDNEDAAATLQQLLTLEGIATTVAYDGASAIEGAISQMPDAIVMDIGMPNLNGYETARRIRASQGGHRPVLIALTGWGQYADRERAREAGFDFHFVKPLNVAALLKALKPAA